MIALVNDRVDLPDGTYAGVWSGYKIREVSDEFSLETEDGCRSLSGMPVTVVVKAGRASAAESAS